MKGKASGSGEGSVFSFPSPVIPASQIPLLQQRDGEGIAPDPRRDAADLHEDGEVVGIGQDDAARRPAPDRRGGAGCGGAVDVEARPVAVQRAAAPDRQGRARPLAQRLIAALVPGDVVAGAILPRRQQRCAGGVERVVAVVGPRIGGDAEDEVLPVCAAAPADAQPVVELAGDRVGGAHGHDVEVIAPGAGEAHMALAGQRGVDRLAVGWCHAPRLGRARPGGD